MKPLMPFLLLLLSACTAMPSENLTGTWWVEEADSAAMPEKVSITLRADGHFSTVGGCNSLFGRYRQSGRSLIFSDTASTLRACFDESYMETDRRLAAAFGSHRTYRISGTRLEWLNESGKVVLKARKTAQ